MTEENVNDASADAEAPTENEETMVDESPAEPVEDVVQETAEESPAATADAADAAAEPAGAPEAVEEAAPEVAAAEPKRKRKRLPRALRPARTRRTRPQSEERKPIVRLPKPEGERGRRQERQGVVVSDAMDKTIVVKVDTIKAHRRYGKVMRRSAKFHAHDESNEAKVGDIVRIVETRPLSATKRWRLAEIVEAAK